MHLYFALNAAALLVVCLASGVLAWDGSHFFFQMLDTQVPAVPASRAFHIPLQWLVVGASRLTADMNILAFTFGLVYAAIPLGALALCWRIVRDASPMLFIWPALGTGLGTLLNQLTLYRESTIALQLAWPLILAILVGMPGRWTPVITLIAIAIVFTHPYAVPLLGFAAAVAVLVATRRTAARRWLCWWASGFALGAALAAVKFALLRTDYESALLSVSVLTSHYNSALRGMPIAALCFVWLSAIAIFATPRLAHGKSRRIAFALATGLISVAGALLATWASDPHKWAGSQDFRTWALFCSAPFIALAVLEAVTIHSAHPPTRPGDLLGRTQLCRLVAVVYVIVLTAQSLTWHALSVQLREEVVGSGQACVAATALPWLHGTALEHWSVTSYSLILQGRTAHTVVAYGGTCEDFAAPHGFHVARFSATQSHIHPWHGMWFDMRPIAADLLTNR